jgi:hypothetical protein
VNKMTQPNQLNKAKEEYMKAIQDYQSMHHHEFPDADMRIAAEYLASKCRYMHDIEEWGPEVARLSEPRRSEVIEIRKDIARHRNCLANDSEMMKDLERLSELTILHGRRRANVILAKECAARQLAQNIRSYAVKHEAYLSAVPEPRRTESIKAFVEYERQVEFVKICESGVESARARVARTPPGSEARSSALERVVHACEVKSVESRKADDMYDLARWTELHGSEVASQMLANRE